MIKSFIIKKNLTIRICYNWIFKLGLSAGGLIDGHFVNLRNWWAYLRGPIWGRGRYHRFLRYTHSILNIFSIFNTLLLISVSLRYLLVGDEWISLVVGIYSTVVYHTIRCGFPNLPTPPNLFEFFVMFKTFLNIDNPFPYLWNSRVSKWNDKLIQ